MLQQNSGSNDDARQALCVAPVPGCDAESTGQPVDSEAAVEFTEEEVIALHWLLLHKVRLLGDERTPLAEKFELVRWVFTDPVRDRQPFSFVNCVRVVAVSPLSHLPFLGAIDAQEIRDWIASRLVPWFSDSMRGYPDWLRQAVVSNPDWVARCLERNPQWINEQVRRHAGCGDLFS